MPLLNRIFYVSSRKHPSTGQGFNTAVAFRHSQGWEYLEKFHFPPAHFFTLAHLTAPPTLHNWVSYFSTGDDECTPAGSFSVCLCVGVCAANRRTQSMNGPGTRTNDPQIDMLMQANNNKAIIISNTLERGWSGLCRGTRKTPAPRGWEGGLSPLGHDLFC